MCVLVSGFSRLGEVAHRFGRVLRYDFTFEILLAQLVGGVTIFILCGRFQPLNSQLRIMDFWIGKEKNFPRSILRCRMALLRCLFEPIESFHTIGNQHRAILVEFASEVLGVEVTAFGFQHL